MRFFNRGAAKPVGMEPEVLAELEPVWMIEPGFLGRFLASRSLGTHASWFDDDDDDDDIDPSVKPYNIEDGVAIIQVTGPLTKQSYWWSGGSSTSYLRKVITMAAADADVSAIFLLIDSPGGMVCGTSDAAAAVAAASEIKPVGAYAEDLCCSAAYWIASQAGAGVWCNQTATVGSVGTIMVMGDYSGYYGQMGIETVVTASGKWKGVGAMGAPITAEQKAYLQGYVDDTNALFLGAVRGARGLSDRKMAVIADAGLFVGEEAVSAGLVDAVTTSDAAKVKLRKLGAAKVAAKLAGAKADAGLPEMAAEDASGGAAAADRADVVAAGVPEVEAPVAREAAAASASITAPAAPSADVHVAGGAPAPPAVFEIPDSAPRKTASQIVAQFIENVGAQRRADARAAAAARAALEAEAAAAELAARRAKPTAEEVVDGWLAADAAERRTRKATGRACEMAARRAAAADVVERPAAPARENVTPTGGEGMAMEGSEGLKNPLVRALRHLGLMKMAVDVVSSDDDSGALASAMSNNVEKEVAERVANHPMMLACEAANLRTPKELQAALEMRDYGVKCLDDLRSEAKAQCVRAHGAELGSRISAAVNIMGPIEVKSMVNAWTAEADAKFGFAQDGTPPARATAPAALNEAVPATAGADAKEQTAWDKLGADKQRLGIQMGCDTPAKKEKFAAHYFTAKAELEAA